MLSASLSLRTFLLTASLTLPTWAAPRGITLKSRLTSILGEAFTDATPIVYTDNVIPFTRRPGSSSKSTAYLNRLRRELNGDYIISQADAGSDEPLQVVLSGSEYIGEITVGEQTVSVVIDSGSSDTWLAKSDFQCISAKKEPLPQSKCSFGETYSSNLLTTTPNVNFNISYGDGEFVTGIFGTQDVTVGGIIVPSQDIALATKAYWNGDNISAGLLGLAYPSLTSEFGGSNPEQDTFRNRIVYDPIFTRMYKDNLSSPSFSMTLQRDSGGYLAFGGIPSEVTPSSDFTSTPIIKMTNSAIGGGPGYFFYAIKPDAILYENSPSHGNTATFIVDSGTTLFYAPSKAARAINALFDPPAVLTGGIYTVSCDYTAVPAVGVKIAGAVFDINIADMVLQDPDSGLCVSGVQDGGAGPFILGDVWMKNVIAVFDVGAAEMRFAAHVY